MDNSREMQLGMELSQQPLMKQWFEMSPHEQGVINEVCLSVCGKYYALLQGESAKNPRKMARDKIPEEMRRFGQEKALDLVMKRLKKSLLRHELDEFDSMMVSAGLRTEKNEKPEIDIKRLKKIPVDQIKLMIQTSIEVILNDTNPLYNQVALETVMKARPKILSSADLDSQRILYTSFLRSIDPLILGNRDQFAELMRHEGGFIRPFDQSLPGHPSDAEFLKEVYGNPFPDNDYQHLVVGLEDTDRIDREENPLLAWVHLKYPHLGGKKAKYAAPMRDYLTHGISGKMEIHGGPGNWEDLLMAAPHETAFIEMVCRDKLSPLAARRVFMLAMQLMRQLNPMIQYVETYRLKYIHIVGIDFGQQWQGGENHASEVLLEGKMGFTEYAQDRPVDDTPYAKQTYRSKSYDIVTGWRHIVAPETVARSASINLWQGAGHKYLGRSFANMANNGLDSLRQQADLMKDGR